MARDQALQKVIDGGLPENYGSDVLGPFKEALAQQISRALQFFYSGSSYNRVDRVILAGGAASIRSIDELVEERLGIAYHRCQPLCPHVDVTEGPASSLHRDAPAMMIAVGLALRGFE